MAEDSVRKIVGSATSVVAGAVIAAVTLVGFISNSVNSGSDQPGNVDEATIPYGTTQ